MAKRILTSEFYNLLNDLGNNRMSTSNKEKYEKAPIVVKQKLIDAFGEDKLSHRVWRRNEDLVYEIIEEMLPISIVNAWRMNPFFDAVADIKNGADGEKNEFVAKEATDLMVAKFAGNTWTTERQAIGGVRSFSVPTEWFTIRVYEELERILRDITTVADMYAAIDDGLVKDLTARIYTAFSASADKLPTKFKETGAFVEETMLDLITRVEIATGKDVTIYGAKQALAKMFAGIPGGWVSDNMKDEKNKIGRPTSWNGYTTVEIPNAFRKGTYDFSFKPNTLYIMTNDRPVKIFYEGEPRMRFLDYTDTEDQSVDIETQVKMGVGVVFSDLHGRYTLA